MAEARLLQLNVVASRLGVTVQTVRRWIRRGQLRAERTPGGHWRIRETALEIALAKRKPYQT